MFGSCIIHILYTGVLKLNKLFRRQKVKKLRMWQSLRHMIDTLIVSIQTNVHSSWEQQKFVKMLNT